MKKNNIGFFVSGTYITHQYKSTFDESTKNLEYTFIWHYNNFRNWHLISINIIYNYESKAELTNKKTRGKDG